MVLYTERNEGEAPYPIEDWLLFPYKYFSWRIGNPNFSLLDLACGANMQKRILDLHWKSVTSGDYTAEGPDIERMNILDIPTDQMYDVTFSLETIEHVPRNRHIEIINNLKKITNHFLVIGTVNVDGPTHLEGHEIWKGGLNPYHVAEYTAHQWKDLFAGHQFFHSVYSGGGRWDMRPGLSEEGVSNYALIKT